MPSVRVILLLLSAMLLTQASRERMDLAIRDVRIVHGDGRVTARATVFVAGGRIRRIVTGAASGRAARVIEGQGRTVIPGLIDAHVRVEPWALPLLLEYGVTTVRDVHNDPARSLPLASEAAVGRPRVVAAGAMIDGPGGTWPDAIEVDDVGDARAAVRRQIAAGAGVIAVHTRLRPSIVSVVVQEARARGVPVAAHLGRTNALEAASAGVTSIELLSGVAEAVSPDRERLRRAHADGFAGWTAALLEWPTLEAAALERVARHLKERNVVLVPALVLYEAMSDLADRNRTSRPAMARVPPDVRRGQWDPRALMRRAAWTPGTLARFSRALPRLQRFVAMYHRLGGSIVAGTGTPEPFVVPGASLHRELELYVEAGLSPAEALRTATTDAAALLGLGERVGRIAEGAAADLVLLEGDPLADITAIRRIVMVVQGGVEVKR